MRTKVLYLPKNFIPPKINFWLRATPSPTEPAGKVVACLEEIGLRQPVAITIQKEEEEGKKKTTLKY